eukprot:361804-Rhodomonas_salina.1
MSITAIPTGIPTSNVGMPGPPVTGVLRLQMTAQAQSATLRRSHGFAIRRLVQVGPSQTWISHTPT